MTPSDANGFLSELVTLVKSGLDQLRPASAQDKVQIIHGYPITIIAAEEKEPEKLDETEIVSTATIYWSGTTLVFESATNGVYGASVPLDSGTAWRAVINGQGFSNGRATAPGMRRDQGGLLVWQYSMQLTQLEGNRTKVSWSPIVDLIAVSQMPQSTHPLARINTYNEIESFRAVQRTGTVYQLCAAYDRAGEITVYAGFPQVSTFRSDLYFNVR